MPICGRCKKPVYTAEEVLAANQSWHKLKCFTCNDCGVGLSSTTVTDKDGEIYCKSCYGKLFGPKGYGYGGGAGTLSMDAGRDELGQARWAKNTAPSSGTGGNPRFGGSKKCPRCGKSVYAAEEMIGAGSSWHKACFNCKDCNKRLDSTTVRDNNGEIYCAACYGKNFGPKGYGYGGGAGALTHTQ